MPATFLLPVWFVVFCIGNQSSAGRQRPYLTIEKQDLQRCNEYVYDRVMNAALYATLLDIIRTFQADDKLTIIVTDRPFGSRVTAGDTHQLNPTTYQITLNTDVLKKASQEYVAATLLHEILHVYIGNSLEADHEVMARQYVGLMADALRSVGFQISPERARALAWGGLQTTRAWRERVLFDRVVKTHYTQEILYINYCYANGIMGVLCPR